ncbi:MAG: BlaI/MecI/CopY family transcriptional regulator [Chloroflexaceae bacterium]|nr:BlaI/MecI/CopY family transcriptional regulator [Chloroflexaceae bacterium]
MPLNMRLRFSPTKDGLVKVLGPLETEIMRLLWQEKRSTVKKVHRNISQKRDIAYTTVMTTMSRLSEKGVLNRHREGLAYVYTPAITEDEFIGIVVRQVLDGLLDDYRNMTIDYMVDYLVRNNPDELKRLYKAIQPHVSAHHATNGTAS